MRELSEIGWTGGRSGSWRGEGVGGEGERDGWSAHSRRGLGEN